MAIGPGGRTIKLIEETTGVEVQVGAMPVVQGAVPPYDWPPRLVWRVQVWPAGASAGSAQATLLCVSWTVASGGCDRAVALPAALPTPRSAAHCVPSRRLTAPPAQ